MFADREVAAEAALVTAAVVPEVRLAPVAVPAIARGRGQRRGRGVVPGAQTGIPDRDLAVAPLHRKKTGRLTTTIRF